jgi:hypothetical protein
MPLRTQNTSPVISALGSPGPVRAPSLVVGGWCWLGYRLPIGWCYWGYPIVPISPYHGLGLLAHIPTKEFDGRSDVDPQSVEIQTVLKGYRRVQRKVDSLRPYRQQGERQGPKAPYSSRRRASSSESGLRRTHSQDFAFKAELVGRGHIMWTHRRNVKNTRAHVNGLKKEHDSSHAEEISRNHGKDHGEKARKEASHQSGGGGTPGLQLQTVQAPGSREGGKKEGRQGGPRSTEMQPADREAIIMPDWLVRQYYQETRRLVSRRRIKTSNTAVSQMRMQRGSTTAQHQNSMKQREALPRQRMRMQRTNQRTPYVHGDFAREIGRWALFMGGPWGESFLIKLTRFAC